MFVKKNKNHNSDSIMGSEISLQKYSAKFVRRGFFIIKDKAIKGARLNSFLLDTKERVLM